MLKEYFKKFFYKLVLTDKSGRSAKKLAISFCWGLFIGCSPLLGIQTYLLIGLSWLFKFNPTISVAAAWLLTPVLIPIYTLSYIFGSWLFEKVLNLDLIAYNPWFVDKFNAFLSRYIDLSKYFSDKGLCFWCFILGSFILSLVISILAYLPVKYLFEKMIKRLPPDFEK